MIYISRLLLKTHQSKGLETVGVLHVLMGILPLQGVFCSIGLISQGFSYETPRITSLYCKSCLAMTGRFDGSCSPKTPYSKHKLRFNSFRSEHSVFVFYIPGKITKIFKILQVVHLRRWVCSRLNGNSLDCRFCVMARKQ